MLTTDWRVTILRKAGVAVPALPARVLPVNERGRPEGVSAPAQGVAEEAAMQAAMAEWIKAIDALYVEYSAARAAGRRRSATARRAASSVGALERLSRYDDTRLSSSTTHTPEDRRDFVARDLRWQRRPRPGSRQRGQRGASGCAAADPDQATARQLPRASTLSLLSSACRPYHWSLAAERSGSTTPASSISMGSRTTA